ncbi:MAG: hypothetical protein M3405_10465 [Acidobacteriota bacterium]|jgi:hypothetical protein|nr:hypothetical protein [Acidobacteriota bacterium]
MNKIQIFVVKMINIRPGGNPLEAAIAAGETPSPEMIAATPKKGALSPKIAFALLLLLIVGFSSASVLHQHFKTYNIDFFN